MATITGNPTSENIAGTFEGDQIFALGGNDNIVSSYSADTISGGDGDDTIDAGDGLDLVEGGLGADRFVISARPLDLPGGETNRDQIGDFTPGVDKIVILSSRNFFENLSAGVIAEGMLRYTNNSSSGIDSGADADDYFVYYDEGDTLLFDYDAGGPTRGFAIATLSGGPALTENDIEVVKMNTVIGGSDSEEFQGTAMHDEIYGEAGDDRFIASGGNDWLKGGAGNDLAVYADVRGNFDVMASRMGNINGYLVEDRAPTIAGNSGVDWLEGITRLRFTDTSTAFDVDIGTSSGDAGTVAKLLGAVFGAAAVADPRIVGIGLYHNDTGAYSFTGLAQLALNARLGPAPTDREVVELLYANVTGNAAPAAAIEFYTGLLENGTYTQAELAFLAANRTENTTRIDLVGLAESGLDYTEYTPG